MAEVCSWCGAVITEPDAKLDFVCSKCGAERRARHETPIGHRPWQAWMPGEYPPLDKTDTRKI